MRISRWALILAPLTVAAAAMGQTGQTKTQVRGPAGRTATRQVTASRTPNTIQRSVQVQGPRGATASRELTVQRKPGGTVDRQVRVAQAPHARAGGGRPVVINRHVDVERNVYVGGGGGWGHGPAFAPGGFSSFNLFFGPPPPPPMILPAPVVVAPPPVLVMPSQPVVEVPPANVVVQEPERYRTEPETIVVDPVANAMKRLYSHHDNSRRDGALTLGRLGDARAVPKLIELVRFDDDTDVRAAAYALGEIGDPQAKSTLQRAALYDRKAKVRNEAALAIGRLEEPRPAPVESVFLQEEDETTAPLGDGWSADKPAPDPFGTSKSKAPAPPLPGLDGPDELFPEALPRVDGSQRSSSQD